MKKIFLLGAMMIGAVVASTAKDRDYAHDESVLPEAAKKIIADNFKSTVSVVKIEKKFGRTSEYDVTLTDGAEITFNSRGKWENVETNRSKAVPAGFIPKEIIDYVKAKHANASIVGIEKECTGYDVELSNGVDIKFDRHGAVRYYQQ